MVCVSHIKCSEVFARLWDPELSRHLVTYALFPQIISWPCVFNATLLEHKAVFLMLHHTNIYTFRPSTDEWIKKMYVYMYRLLRQKK